MNKNLLFSAITFLPIISWSTNKPDELKFQKKLASNGNTNFIEKNSALSASEKKKLILESIHKTKQELEQNLETINEVKKKETKKNIKKIGLVFLSVIALELTQPLLEPISPLGYLLIRNIGYLYSLYESLKLTCCVYKSAEHEIHLKSKVSILNQTIKELRYK